jgi:hypothetical protein
LGHFQDKGKEAVPEMIVGQFRAGRGGTRFEPEGEPGFVLGSTTHHLSLTGDAILGLPRGDVIVTDINYACHNDTPWGRNQIPYELAFSPFEQDTHITSPA